MSIEESIFGKYLPNFNKLEKYGFEKKKDFYAIEKLFLDNSFKAFISVTLDGTISGIVYDLENNDEFLPLRIEGYNGAFVAEVKNAYEDLLKDIRNKCFSKQYFIYSQSNRITNLIIKKYGDEPEFLWEKFDDCGVFRNPQTKKWYAAILDVDRGKIQPEQKGLVEVIDIKLSSENVKKQLQQKHFYSGYHMNKKYWISIILDDTVSDSKIMELVEESHSFTEKK
ncbi:MmcQ/YjbR family DNA-binding protein [bacterium]|nr:MmcQ/YjbR family DNA-binding protein [bacterium]